MNKVLLICAVFICATLVVHAQQKFTITGKFTGLKEQQKITLRYSTGEKFIMDTAIVINGVFSFSGKVQFPVKASLYLIPVRPGKMAGTEQQLQYMEGTQHFFVEQGGITVSGRKNMKDALIQGGKTQQEYLLLKKQLSSLQDALEKWHLQFRQLMSQKRAEAEKKFGPELTADQETEVASAAQNEMPPGLSPSELHSKITRVEHDFIRRHPDSYVSFALVQRYSRIWMDANTFESLYNSLSRRILNTVEARRLPIPFLLNRLNSLNLEELKSAYAMLGKYQSTSLATEAGEAAKKILQRINLLETTIGSPGIPIKKVDINGNPVNWESFKGKYLLLDFWSSSCGACRASHPHLKELYAKYKNKGFEILGIADEYSSSLEDKKKSWKSAIKKDGLPWPQVLNNIEKETFDAFKAYVTGYGKILLDKDGKVMGRYNEADLDHKLKEVFGF